MFHRWISTVARPTSAPRHRDRNGRRLTPGLDALEGRQLLAASVSLSSGILKIEGTNVADVVRVEASGSNVRVVARSAGESSDTIRTFAAGGVKSIQFNGKDGNDRFANAVPLVSRAIGGDGDDILVGGPARDALFGGPGADTLDGGGQVDFLDTGANAGDVIKNGASDYNARIPVVGGTTDTDIQQRLSPTCSLLAALQGLARHGVNLAGGISYVGEGVYRVRLFSSPGVVSSQLVKFEGDLDLRRDPQTVGNEFWTVLYQRAYVQLKGRAMTDPGEALLALTGKNSRFLTLLPADLLDLNFNAMRDALVAKKTIIPTTAGALFGHPLVVGTATADRALGTLFNGKEVVGHAYTVVATFTKSDGTKMVRLRNPWGKDGGQVASGDADDALIEIKYSDFKTSFGAIWIEG